MKEKITIEGRSLVFNIVFVVLNLIGLTFLVMGYHDSALTNSTLYKSIGLILLMLSTGGLIVFRGRLMMSNVSRVLVGGLFYVSMISAVPAYSKNISKMELWPIVSKRCLGLLGFQWSSSFKWHSF